MSDRGRQWGLRATMVVEGSFLSHPDNPIGEMEVKQKITALEDAYRDNHKNAGFIYNIDGVVSASDHYLTQDSQFNLTGNRIIYRDWSYKSPAEMANTRSFTIGLSADFALSESFIISFQETVNFIGNGTPDWDYQERWNGAPQKITYANQTVIRAQQTGMLICLQPFPNPPSPLWPTYEQGKYRRITRRNPHDHGHPSGKYSHYMVAWSYRFAFPSVQNGTPNNYGY